MNGNYDIASLERLEESASALAWNNQSLTNDGQSLDYIMKTISENWENEEGQDIESIMEKLKETLKTIRSDLQPTIANYVTIINTIVADTKKNQSGAIFY